MKNNTFIIEQKPFLALLSAMQPICTKRTTLDATLYILFQINHKELILKSTDLEISLQSSYLLEESNMQESRSFLVNGKRLFELVKELEGNIVFVIENNQLLLQTEAVNLSLHIRDAQDFPPFPERIENLMQISSSFLLELLSKVAFLIPQNNANSALNGLFVEFSTEGLKLTATDGHCLVQVSTDTYSLSEEKKWLLPRRAIFEVKKILESSQDSEIFIGLCANQLVFSGETFNFFTKLLVDTFPEYKPILNKEGFIPAVVDRTHLIKTLRRSSCLLSGQFIATTFGFSPQKLHVSMQNKEVGQLQEDVPLHKFEGSSFDARFYAPYLLNGLQVFSDQDVEFYLHNQLKPIIFNANAETADLKYNMVFLVMPITPMQGT